MRWLALFGAVFCGAVISFILSAIFLTNCFEAGLEGVFRLASPLLAFALAFISLTYWIYIILSKKICQLNEGEQKPEWCDRGATRKVMQVFVLMTSIYLVSSVYTLFQENSKQLDFEKLQASETADGCV